MSVLEEQKRYYAARAPEYDDWWYRRGRYALDSEQERGWLEDVAEAEARLREFAPRGDVLELAAGTGIWTRKLVPLARRVVAVDANAETLALNTPAAELVQADVFAWRPDERFDACFFSFWLSHVPEERFDEFWATVRDALKPGGRVFLVDSGAGDRAHTGVDQQGEHETRTISDGRAFRIVKRRWEPEQLAARVRSLRFELELATTANGHFLVGGGA
ncbi:MAG TPA: class I SAM-dependent methyltransferase [Gaiellaceae bacterium]|nr:class I SAM-dependent methyltransferase [Gaiellaceae bacterium]